MTGEGLFGSVCLLPGLPIWDVLVGSHFSLPLLQLADFYMCGSHRVIPLDLFLGLEFLPLAGEHLQARTVRLRPQRVQDSTKAYKEALDITLNGVA